MKYIDDIKSYKPINDQETIDKEKMIEIYNTYGDLSLTRDIEYHFTASAWIVNKDITKVLLNFHNIYQNWGWLGGHADGDIDMSKVAIKEAMEESGLRNIKLLTDSCISLEILPVPKHIKKGKEVKEHFHMNLTYLLMADDKQKLTIKPDENSGLKWVDLDDAPILTNEECMKPVYRKLNNFAHFFKKCMKNEA